MDGWCRDLNPRSALDGVEREGPPPTTLTTHKTLSLSPLSHRKSVKRPWRSLRRWKVGLKMFLLRTARRVTRRVIEGRDQTFEKALFTLAKKGSYSPSLLLDLRPIYTT